MTINISYPQLGIDTSSPLALSVNSASPAFKITQTGAGDCFLVEDSASTDTTPFVINAAGRVLKNRTISTDFFGLGGQADFQIHGNFPMSLSSWSTSPTPACKILFTKSNSNTIGTGGLVTVNTNLGTLEFAGSYADGNGFGRAAQISAAVDYIDGVNAYIGGRLLFSTITNFFGGPPLETMRLDSQGFVGINKTAPVSQLHLGSTAGLADSGTICIDEKDTTPANPSDGSQAKVYMKSDKIVIQYNDAGTVKYRYMDLTDTTATWTYTTTAP
jgi:hypothetical protein